ncbi:MAG: antitoxin family protein [Isosphaeraceae bacterium]
MTLTVEAVYENGVLKLTQPLPLREREKVQVTVLTQPSVAQQTYGMLGWKGAAEAFDQLLLESDLDQ